MNEKDKDNQNIEIIREFLSELKEEDLYEPLRDLFIAKGYEVWITHGEHEHGKDLVATLVNSHNLKINVKKGDIDSEKWRTDVFASLSETMVRKINHTGVDESLPWKPILIFNGNMTTSLYQNLDEFNKFYQKNKCPQVEVWDINRLAIEFNEYLMASNLLANTYLEILHRLILSVNEESIDHTLAALFVDEHFSYQQKKFSSFKLAFIYLLRRSESKSNFYAFFYLAEYALVKAWDKILEEKDFSLMGKFDEIHHIYLDTLKRWLKISSRQFSLESGLVDLAHGGLSEIASYPLRTFDVIRRISYIAYIEFIDNRISEARTFVKILIKIIKNNRAAYTPLCEFNYTDIGIALTVLRWAKEEEMAKEWLFGLSDFLVSHYKSGYKLMPLGNKIETVFEAIFRKEYIETKSHLFPLIFEFAILFDSENLYNIFSPKIPKRIVFSELVIPTEDKEEEIFDTKFLHATEIRILSNVSWSQLKIEYKTRIKFYERKLSPIIYKHPYVLILTSNVFRDRYFPSIWRNIDIETRTHALLVL